MPVLTDSTLREGAQACGVSFSLAARKRIATLLAAVGVEEMEVGVATDLDPDLPPLVAHCRRLQERFGFRIALWCRCRDGDIAQAAALGPDVLALSIPGSDLHLDRRLGRSRQWVLAGKLRELGCRLSGDDLTRLTREVRRRSVTLGRPLADAELVRLAQG